MPDSAVTVYSVGLCYASACAPEQMSTEEVERWVQHQYPSGVTPWRVSDEHTFADGTSPNPHPCERTPGRVHWLLVC